MQKAKLTLANNPVVFFVVVILAVLLLAWGCTAAGDAYLDSKEARQ